MGLADKAIRLGGQMVRSGTVAAAKTVRTATGGAIDPLHAFAEGRLQAELDDYFTMPGDDPEVFTPDGLAAIFSRGESIWEYVDRPKLDDLRGLKGDERAAVLYLASLPPEKILALVGERFPAHARVLRRYRAQGEGFLRELQELIRVAVGKQE